MPLYTEDFDTEIYSAVQQSNSYRIDIKYDEKFNNYVYFFKIFGVSGKLLTMNGWTLVSRPLKRAYLRDISQKQYLADIFNKRQKSPHGSFEVVCGGS